MFVNRMDPATNKQVNEGYCLNCAREMNLGPVDEILKSMGITPEQFDEINNGMNEFINSMGEFDADGEDGEFDAENSPLAMMQGFGNLFGGSANGNDFESDKTVKTAKRPSKKKKEF